jgi:hemolysin III
VLQQELPTRQLAPRPASPPSPLLISPRAKPLLRGWLHAAAAVVCAPLLATLIWRGGTDWTRLAPLLLFGASMLELYSVSALFHIWTWSARRYRFMRTLDHDSIFVAIAGSYTPLGIALLGGPARVLLLGAVWLLTVSGILLKARLAHMSRGLSTGLYLGLGWAVVLALPAFWTRLPPPASGLLAVGGALYTAGALVYGWRRPDPFPDVFGFHELFHVLVIGGSAAIALVIWGWIAPML